MRNNLFEEMFFALGVNLAWLDNQYDHDFGKNEIMGYDFRAYDEEEHKSNMDAYLKDISLMGTRVVRLWLFERFEGLKFDEDGNVKGVDDGLLDNIADVLNTAKKYDLHIYLCLMDTWGVSVQSQENLPRLNAMIVKEETRKSFIENALKALVSDSRIKNSKLFAIDVMNEPEGLYTSIWRKEIEWSDVISFITDCTSSIHDNSNFKVSCGFQQYQTLIDSKDELNDLDFYDYHEYNDDGLLLPYSNLGLTKPCIIGECGQKSERYDDKIYDRTIKQFLKNAWKNGYAGCLVWNYNYKGYDSNDSNNRHSLIKSDGSWRNACNSLVSFSRKHRKHMLL